MEKWLKVEVTAFCKLYSEFPKEFMAEVLNSPSSTESASLVWGGPTYKKSTLQQIYFHFSSICICNANAHHEYILVHCGPAWQHEDKNRDPQTYHILPKAKQTLSCNIGQSSKAKVSSIISVLGQSQVISRADDYWCGLCGLYKHLFIIISG